MTLAILYTLAVEEGLPPVVGAAPYSVLARQLPRLVVNQMNGDRDEGVRFFPLLGTVEGKRQFFSIPEMLDAERLMTLHGLHEGVPFVVDGRIGNGAISFRVHDEKKVTILEKTVEFDPLDPLPAAKRMLFELSGVFGWHGALPEMLDIEQPALSYYLVAKDDLLCLEAGFGRDEDEQWVKAARTLFDLLPDHREVQIVLLDICRHLVRGKIASSEVKELLMHAVQGTEALEFAGESAAILDDLGHRQESDNLFERIVGEPKISEAVAVRLAGFLFRRGRFSEGRDHLEGLMARGVTGTRLLAQIAVFYQRLGQHDERRAVIDELARRTALPSAVGRMVCCELVDQGRVDDALSTIGSCIEATPGDPAVWLEKGRVLLHGENPTDAGAALEEVFRNNPSPTIKEEAARLRRFVDLPDVLPALRTVDAALVGNHLERAVRLANELVRVHPSIAEAWLFLGVAYQRAEVPGEAIRALQRAVDLDASLGEAHNRLGILLVGGGRHREGFEQLKLAIACLPTESGPQIHMAQACYFLGELNAGREALREAERLGANPQTVESVRGMFFSD